jgi:hypothetical protein
LKNFCNVPFQILCALLQHSKQWHVPDQAPDVMALKLELQHWRDTLQQQQQDHVILLKRLVANITKLTHCPSAYQPSPNFKLTSSPIDPPFPKQYSTW